MSLVHDMLSAAAATAPDRPAVLFEGARQTYAELDGASARLAGHLRGLGVERGDRVVIVMENTPELPVWIFGVMKAGGVPVAAPGQTRAGRLGYIVRDCGARVIGARSEHAGAVREAMGIAGSAAAVVWSGERSALEAGHSLEAMLERDPPCGGDARVIDQDLAAIIYTSGTTGEPKGVMLTHRNLVNTTGAIVSYLENNAEDVVCCVLPLAFSYGLCQLLGAVRTGSALQLERSFAFPYDVLSRMSANRATGFPALPTVFARLLQMGPLEGVDLSSVRYVTNAAAPIPTAHIRGVRALLPGAKFYSMYGQTECTRAAYLDPAMVEERTDSVGKAISNSEIYCVDEGGSRVGPGVVGELVVRGANVMRGYWGRPEETAKKLREGPIAGEKVLHTGDLFRIDAEGYAYFVSRTDDVFKCRGEKVSPREIENALCELAGVAEAAVVGVEDAMDGSAVKAVIVAAAGVELNEQTVRKHCRQRLEGVQVPKYIEFRSALPRTAAGKLDRSALRVPGAGR